MLRFTIQILTDPLYHNTCLGGPQLINAKQKLKVMSVWLTKYIYFLKKLFYI